ncbi:MAG: DUF1287 domain-containing protein [Candidatus Humimicrobiaceae bacterium]
METGKRFNIKHFLIIILVLVIALGITISVKEFSFTREYEPPTAVVEILPRYRIIDFKDRVAGSDFDGDGTIDQEDILLGAKKQLKIKAENIKLVEGEPNYYQGGDPPESLALCTDIIARAFWEAGYDLRELVNRDISNNFNQYPLKEIWNQNVSDPNIDYRRIQNLEIYFDRNAEKITSVFNPADKKNLEEWLPGDVVFFDMDGDGYTDNVGIISDSTTREGIPKVIYNYIEPGHTCEKDILGEKTITGHYRYPKN